MEDIELTKEQLDEIFSRLWDENIFLKHKNEPPSLREFSRACEKAIRDG